MNWLSDMDWGWWPVLRLRPRREHDIDDAVLLRMTAVFGPVTGALVVLEVVWMARKFHRPLTPGLLMLGLLAGCGIFYLAYKFTFAFFWNRRARRLRAPGGGASQVARSG